MNKAQQKRYESLYRQHVNALHRQGKAKTTIDVYSRAVRRITEYFDRCPDRLSTDDLKEHFTNLVNTHSCGHRSCHRCQNHDTSRWLDRQSQKAGGPDGDDGRVTHALQAAGLTLPDKVAAARDSRQAAARHRVEGGDRHRAAIATRARRRPRCIQVGLPPTGGPGWLRQTQSGQARRSRDAHPVRL